MNAVSEISPEQVEAWPSADLPTGGVLIDSAELTAMQAWRRAIHQHPELGFEEHETSRLVAERLREWGYEVTTGLAVTGVVGTLRWGEASRAPRLGLRADMDALPISERTGLPWASRVAGRMHACGHDGHTAMLLGAARRLAQAVAEARMGPAGTLHLIFQPPEELGGGGGAQRMIAEGLLIGNGDNGHDGGRQSGPCNVHNPHYDFNDACLPVGAALWSALAQHFFAADSR